MKKQTKPTRSSRKTEAVEQPEPFTRGVTKAMVRQHALELYRDKLAHGKLTLQDWVLAEKDLVSDLQTSGLAQHPAIGTLPEGR